MKIFLINKLITMNMKKFFSLAIILAIVGIFSSRALAETALATENYSSGIERGDYTVTLSDGTVLGFSLDIADVGSGRERGFFFRGAISTSEHIILPDEITLESSTYNVLAIGSLDMSQATATHELTFGEHFSYVDGSIPSSIENIHFQGSTVPSLNYRIPSSTTVWVPQSAYASYLTATQNSNSKWYGTLVHYEGWEPKTYTVNVRVAGSFVNEMFKLSDQWNDVDKLVVTGTLNDEDMSYFSRFSSLTELDLTGTDIEKISGCSGLNRLQKISLPSTVNVIGSNAFYECASLENIDFSNIKEIGASAFYGCKSLITINAEKLETIGTSAFYNCSALESFIAPKLKEIPGSAFERCSSLSNFDFSKIEYLGGSSFSGCSSLTIVNADNLKEIADGYDIFNECSYSTPQN